MYPLIQALLFILLLVPFFFLNLVNFFWWRKWSEVVVNYLAPNIFNSMRCCENLTTNQVHSTSHFSVQFVQYLLCVAPQDG